MKKNINYKKELLYKLKVFTALFVVSAMLIQFFGNNYLLAYSQDNVIATYDIGVDKDTVTATLTSDGMLTLSGSGDTMDYTAETMPFADNVDKISTLVIEDGITSLGNYLFFGCKNLNDKLEIPKTIVHIGDYAFNGYSKETAPAFTYITNDFKSADITVPVETKEEQPETEKSVLQETKEKEQEPQNTEPETNSQNVNESDPVNTENERTKMESSTSKQPVDTATTDNHTDDTETIPDEQTPQSSGQIEIKTITEQEIGTDIFYPNQTGGYKAEKTNKSFRTAVETAGYIEADRFVTVKLDNVITQHLPVKDGKLIIPDRPNYGIEPTEPDDAYTTHKFSGWSIDNQTLQPKDAYAIADNLDEILLISEWNTEWSIQPQVQTEAKEEMTVYSVIDKNTQKEIEKAEGYTLSVQWQMNSKDKEDESSWEDIRDATSSTYERKVQSGDTSNYFRAKITILKETKFRTVSDPKIFITDSVNGEANIKIGLGQVKIIYHYNDESELNSGLKEGYNGAFNESEKTYTVISDVRKATTSEKLYGSDIAKRDDIYQYKVELIANPFIDHPTSANGVSAVNELTNWVQGSSSSAYTNWNYPNGDVGSYSNDNATNPEKELTDPNYYMPDSTYILADNEMKKYDQGEQLELHFYAYWGKVIYISADGSGAKDGSSVNDSIGVNGTYLQAAYNKVVDGDMFSNIIMLTSDVQFGTRMDWDNTFKSVNSKGATITSQNNKGKRFNLIIPNRGPIFSSDVRFTNIGLQTIYCNWPALNGGSGFLFIDNNVIGSMIYNDVYYDLNNMYSNVGGGDYRLALFGGAKGCRIESGFFRRITGAYNTVSITNNIIDGTDIENPLNFNDELVGALNSSTTSNTYISGYVTGVGVIGGGSSGNVTYSNLTVKGNAVLAWGIYDNGNYTTKTSMYGGGRNGRVNNANMKIESGAIISGNIYASGDQSSATVLNESVLNMVEATIYGDVYGGGNLGSSNSTALTIKNSNIYGNIYGGGNNANATSSSINIDNSSIFGNIYGGSNQTGITTTSNVNIQGIIDNNVYAGGKGSETTVTNANLNIKDGANIKGNAFGGSEQGTVTNSIVNLNGGYAKNVFGGSDQASITGSVSINSLAGSNAGNIYAGCNASGSVKNPTLNLAGKAENVYGGGNATPNTVSDVDGNTTITVTSNADNKIANVYGGSNSSGLVTSPSVNINGYVGNVYGGGYGANTITNTPVINIQSATVDNAYGGGNLGIVHGTQLTLAAYSTVTNAFAGGNQVGIEDGTVLIRAVSTANITNMYGGSNSSGTVKNPTIQVDGSDGRKTNITNLYGGGEGKNTKTESPIINIHSYATLGKVFGGGNLGQVSNPALTIGKTGDTVNTGTAESVFVGGNSAGITGSGKVTVNPQIKVANLYGGSNASGQVDAPSLTINGDVEHVYGGGYGGTTNDGEMGTFTSNPDITIQAGTVTDIYGGGEKGVTTGTNKIKVTGGTITNIFGGGNVASSENADIILNNTVGTITNVYGGCNTRGDVKKTTIDVDGNITSVYGGGKGENTTVSTSSYVKTSAGSTVNNIYGGSEQGSVKDATLVIHGPVNGSVYGGGYGDKSVIKGNTWVYIAGNVSGNIYGGGNQGEVNGNTHVDIASGTIGASDNTDTGNVFGGSNQAKVSGNTVLHIGSYVVTTPDGATLPTGDEKKLTIYGTVFGGGNTTSSGKDFDASDPYVLGTATVEIGGTDYTLDIKKSIFGDGNKCVTNGDKTINIKDYTALGANANTSIQRATTLVIENSDIELIGEKDTANLVTTINYSLNRIDKLKLKNGTLLKLQSPVNLVMGLESLNADDNYQTSAEANNNTTGNRLYIQQGQHVDLRINEDVSRPGYGDIKGFTQLGRYYVNGSSIDKDAQGVYVMGSYYTDSASNTNSGFIVADDETFAGQIALHKGDKITATTNSTSWRNWLLGSSIKNATKNMVISDEPGDGKTAMVTETWAADGSIYRIDPDSVKIEGNSKYTIVNPNEITSSSPENTIGLSIETGQTGWLEQIKAGYIDSVTGKIIPYKTGTVDAASVDDSLDMRSIVNDQQSPVINVKLYNSENITANDNTPVTVSFTVDRISEQTDGSEVKTGSIIVTLNITQKATISYTNVLVSQGKTYDRGEQSYNYDTASGAAATSVSKSSAITAQFAEKSDTAKTVTGYTLNIKSGQTLSDSSLPIGTKVLMIDKSGSTPVYYNYTEEIGNSNVLLTNFTKNGTSEKYQLPSGSISKSNFIFIFDFMNTSSDKDLLVSLISKYSSGESSEKKLRFKASGNERSYKLSSQQDNSSASTIPSYRMNGTFGITLNTTATVDASAGTDTTGSDLQMAAKVQLKLTNTETGTVLPIPKGWQIQSNGTRYSTSGDSATIILANSLTATNSDIFVIMSNMGDIPAGNYKLEISLVSGAMANYPLGTLDTKTIIYRFTLTDDRYSIKSTIRDEAKQVIVQTDTDKTLSYDVIRVSNGSSSTSNIETKLTLWKKKDDGTYEEVTFTDTVEQLSDITTGREIPITNQIIPWATYKTISIKLKDAAAIGTYQLRYEIVEKSKANSVLASEVSSFIVTKE